MGVMFTIAGERADYVTGENYLDMAQSNAADLLTFLGYEVDEQVVGDLTPGDLRRRCEAVLADPLSLARDLPRGGATFERVVVGERRMGYLTEKTEALLKLAKRAGDRVIRFA